MAMKTLQYTLLALFAFSFTYSQNPEILLNGTVSAENNQIKNIQAPTDPGDAATMSYVSDLIESAFGEDLPDGVNSGDVLIKVWDEDTNSWINTVNSSLYFLSLNTIEADYIAQSSASAGGQIISDGGSSIIAKGLVWSTSPDPDVSLQTKTDEGPGAGSFTSLMTGLLETTTYFYRAYASTSNETSYGVTFVIDTLNGDEDLDGDNFTPNQGDCNDNDPSINPNGIEISGDGIDQDCDGSDITLDSPVYLHANGVTVVARDWAQLGDTGYINGIEYTVVDDSNFFTSIGGYICTTLVTNMDMYNGGTYISAAIDAKTWDTSNVIDMSTLFYNTNIQYMVSPDFSFWDTSSVTDMSQMFLYSTIPYSNTGGCFLQDMGINNWDTSSVTNMYAMFKDLNTLNSCTFGADLNNWDTSSVTDMTDMFSNVWLNPIISSWDVSNVIYMTNMFKQNPIFNNSISNWDVGNVISMQEMFWDAYAFNQYLGNWNVSNVVYFRGMFTNTTSFNSSIQNWDTSSAQEMNLMFYNAGSFNQDLSSWNVDNVTNCTDFCSYAVSWSLPKPTFTLCDSNCD